MSDPNECKALVISCIDFRFITRTRDYLIDRGLKDAYDLITIPGASLNVENITQGVEASIKLHNPKEIYIFDHEDCGAYGSDNSTERHSHNLKQAKKLLEDKYPRVGIKTLTLGFDNINEVINGSNSYS